MPLKLSLTNLQIFKFLDDEGLSALTDKAKVVAKHRGEIVLMQDEPVPGIYVIGEGSASVFATTGNRPLADLFPGDSFGEMSFVERAKASASIRAGADGARFAVFMHSDLDALTASVPGFGQALFRGIALSLSKKLRATTDQVSQELKVGKSLLCELVQQGADAPDLQQLGAAIEMQMQSLLGALDFGVGKLDTLCKLLPERTGSIGEVSLRLDEARTKARSAMPQLVAQIKVLADFLARMEDFVLQNSPS